MLLTSTLENIGILDAAVVAVLGYVVVFFGLILLMAVVVLLGKFFIAQGKSTQPKAAEKPAAPVAAPAPAPAAPAAPAAAQLAPGSAGQLKLYDTNPKTAAMIMAIVADKMGKPLNELRFISIKEVK